MNLLAVVVKWCKPTPIPQHEEVEILGGPYDGLRWKQLLGVPNGTERVSSGRLYVLGPGRERRVWRYCGAEQVKGR